MSLVFKKGNCLIIPRLGLSLGAQITGMIRIKDQDQIKGPKPNS